MLYVHEVKRMSDMYDLYVSSELPEFLESIDVFEGTLEYDWFIELAEKFPRLFTHYSSVPLDLE